jgi:tetratricopeptide (TPR) repeat protein
MAETHDNPYIKISDLDQNLDVFDSLRNKSGTKNRLINILQILTGLTGVFLIFLSFTNSSYFFIGALILAVRVYWKKSESPENYNIEQAKILYRKKRYTKAIPHLIKLIEYFSDEPYLKLMLAESYMRIGEKDKAFDLYNRTIMNDNENKIDPQVVDKHFVNAMHLAINKKDWDTTITLGDKIKQTKEQEFHMKLYSHHYQGIAYYHRKDLINAKYHFKKVFEMDSEFKKIREILKGIKNQEEIDHLFD